MKEHAREFLAILICGIAVAAVSYSGGYQHGHKAATPFIASNYWWEPKIGDRVATALNPDGSIMTNRGQYRIVTITNVVNVGRETCQSGILVYGDGLPGVDSSWIKPAP